MGDNSMSQQKLFDTDRLIPTYFKLALPVVFSMVVTLIYNLADTYFIAKTNDAMLVAGVSLCAPLFTLLMAIGNIYGQGGSSLIARLLGKGDRASVCRVSGISVQPLRRTCSRVCRMAAAMAAFRSSSARRRTSSRPG